MATKDADGGSGRRTTTGGSVRNRNAYCSFCRKSYRDVGPLVEGSGSDVALARVLDPLVDSVEPVRRDGREWLMLQLER